MSSTKIRNMLLEDANEGPQNTNNNNNEEQPLLDPRIFKYMKDNNLLYKKRK
jgi:hypothetical protein